MLTGTLRDTHVPIREGAIRALTAMEPHRALAQLDRLDDGILYLARRSCFAELHLHLDGSLRVDTALVTFDTALFAKTCAKSDVEHPWKSSGTPTVIVTARTECGARVPSFHTAFGPSCAFFCLPPSEIPCSSTVVPGANADSSAGSPT